MDKVMSAASAAQSDNPPLYYLLYCINPAPTVLEKVVENLEDKVKKDPGLPQTGGPTTGPKGAVSSLELFNRWKKERQAYDNSPQGPTGSRDRDLLKKMNDTMREGIAMSCTYFSNMHLTDGKPGPVPYLDCRDAWKAGAANQKPASKGTGSPESKAEGANNGVEKAGSGRELSLLRKRTHEEEDAASAVRLAALERFEGRLKLAPESAGDAAIRRLVLSLAVLPLAR
jgi:hypothetical protein